MWLYAVVVVKVTNAVHKCAEVPVVAKARWRCFTMAAVGLTAAAVFASLSAGAHQSALDSID
jgi:hypothetical protein